MYEAILLLLLELTPDRTDRAEDPAKRRARLEVAAAGMADAVAAVDYFGDREEAAALIAQGDAESNYAAYVGEGRCTEGPAGQRCDPDKHGRPRARTYWQVWQVTCPRAWAATPGSREEAREAAICTLRVMASGFTRCRKNGYDAWTGAFAALKGGASCVTKSAPVRVRKKNALMSRLR